MTAKGFLSEECPVTLMPDLRKRFFISMPVNPFHCIDRSCCSLFPSSEVFTLSGILCNRKICQGFSFDAEKVCESSPDRAITPGINQSIKQ